MVRAGADEKQRTVMHKLVSTLKRIALGQWHGQRKDQGYGAAARLDRLQNRRPQIGQHIVAPGSAYPHFAHAPHHWNTTFQFERDADHPASTSVERSAREPGLSRNFLFQNKHLKSCLGYSRALL
jgi:hypothetical protein